MVHQLHWKMSKIVSENLLVCMVWYVPTIYKFVLLFLGNRIWKIHFFFNFPTLISQSVNIALNTQSKAKQTQNCIWLYYHHILVHVSNNHHNELKRPNTFVAETQSISCHFGKTRLLFFPKNLRGQWWSPDN